MEILKKLLAAHILGAKINMWRPYSLYVHFYGLSGNEEKSLLHHFLSLSHPFEIAWYLSGELNSLPVSAFSKDISKLKLDLPSRMRKEKIYSAFPRCQRVCGLVKQIANSVLQTQS